MSCSISSIRLRSRHSRQRCDSASEMSSSRVVSGDCACWGGGAGDGDGDGDDDSGGGGDGVSASGGGAGGGGD
jgi:hypothetical protein